LNIRMRDNDSPVIIIRWRYINSASDGMSEYRVTSIKALKKTLLSLPGSELYIIIYHYIKRPAW
jgi:hypothetical protein